MDGSSERVDNAMSLDTPPQEGNRSNKISSLARESDAIRYGLLRSWQKDLEDRKTSDKTVMCANLIMQSSIVGCLDRLNTMRFSMKH
jgi:hypothetical protein